MSRGKIFVACVTVLSMTASGVMAMDGLGSHKELLIGMGVLNIMLTAILTVCKPLIEGAKQ